MAAKLTEYRRKRRFKRTPEPIGKAGRGKGDLTFIVHLHDATRLHHDLRLELDGVLKSWAVPKGPSLNPTEQRLAVKVEDHPMEYGKFEGVIPEGNYGAGPVIVWDKGTYRERRSKTRAESEIALRKGLQKGHITFVLDGTKLKGEFALVRMQESKNWLLIKKGDAYSSYKKVDWDQQSVVSKKTIGKVENEKTSAIWTRAGRSDLPRVRVMVAISKREAPTGAEWIWQEFGKGERVLAEVDKGKAHLYSRARVSLDKKFPKIATALKAIEKSAIFDGEVVGEPEQLKVLDLIYWDGEDLREKPLADRLKKLRALKLPKTLEVAPSLKGPSSDGHWVARDKSSAYGSGISNDWVRGKTGAPARVFLTNPTKKLWPKEGYTKKDLVDYYRAVSSAILPHLRDRPLSLHRYPNGIGSTGFFQKDLTGYLPKDVHTFAHYSGSSARTIHYAVCNEESTLLYLANLACIELNPWMSRTTDIDAPDFCVIDLDPDGNAFDEVVEVAQAYKKILDSLKVKAFCKTSGATGLHIYVPWKGKVTYDDSRAFALAVSSQIFEKFPQLTSLERSPAKRRKKIYLDCFQNSRGQTVVAPYSVRPNPGAPVSTPLEWKELTSHLKPVAFTIRSIPERLSQRGDVWKSLQESGNDLTKLLKKLQ